jgi:hypothetical protein
VAPVLLAVLKAKDFEMTTLKEKFKTKDGDLIILPTHIILLISVFSWRNCGCWRCCGG